MKFGWRFSTKIIFFERERQLIITLENNLFLTQKIIIKRNHPSHSYGYTVINRNRIYDN